MISLVFWLGEFVLEVSGAVLAFRRNLFLLYVLLGFRAIMDVVTFFLHGDYYGAFLWAGQCGQYLIMVAMAAELVAAWIRESGKWKLTLWAAVIGGILTVKAFILADSWPHRFLDAEIAASMSAGVVVCLGWLTRKKPLERIQAGIATGLVISLAGNGACAMLWQVWDGARFLYPIPAIAALIVWNWAASQRQLGEFRREIPTSTRELPKKPVQSAREPRMLSERIN